MERTHASGRPIRWADGPTPQAAPTRRGGQRVAWDHSVLEGPKSDIQWNARSSGRQRDTTPARPIGALAACWALLVWAGLGVVGVWTRPDVDAHLSMRLMALGNFEEVLGVVMGVIWFITPAAGAFWVARHARLVSGDTSGGRSYWVAVALAAVAGLGVLRPMWDRGAGSRFGGRGTIAAPVNTTDPTESGIGESAFGTGLDPWSVGDEALATTGDTGEPMPFFGPPALPSTASVDPW